MNEIIKKNPRQTKKQGNEDITIVIMVTKKNLFKSIILCSLFSNPNLYIFAVVYVVFFMNPDVRQISKDSIYEIKYL